MEFPHYFNLFGLRLHPHPVLEVIAYSAGFQFYLLLRRRWPRRNVVMPFEQNLWVIVGAVFGALVGAKVLAWLESPGQYWSVREQVGPMALLSGKTIVGGLLGGWAGVEIAKKRFGITPRTGDVYVFPLILGMCIGRVGCFLTGLTDHTHGIETTLPWAVDFGDGLRRHPTQLYEIAFLLALAIGLLLRMRHSWTDGTIFRMFMLSYLGFRFAAEFVKPTQRPIFALSAIQVASVVGALVCLVQLVGGRSEPQAGLPVSGRVPR